MSNTDNGGPAFPQQDIYHPNGMVQYGSSGMSLRDYFAGQAMQGLLAQSVGTALGSPLTQAAEYAYAMADAMLSVREARKERG